MKKFISSIVKLAVIGYAAILFFLIGFAVLLTVAPKLLLKLAYFAVLAACVIAIIYLLVGLLGVILICNIKKKEFNNSVKRSAVKSFRIKK